jgi:hypothetical protein
MAIHPPLIMPYFITASTVYCEQVGGETAYRRREWRNALPIEKDRQQKYFSDDETCCHFICLISLSITTFNFFSIIYDGKSLSSM